MVRQKLPRAIHRRYGTKEEISAIIPGKEERRYPRMEESKKLRFLPVSVYYLFSRLLDLAVVPENPYLMEGLQEKYDAYGKKMKKQFLFSIPELFEEGWLILIAEEWQLNSNRYSFERIKSVGKERERQIIGFLKVLGELPYKDAIKLELPKENLRELEQLQITVDWLLENEVVISEKGRYFINAFSDIWENYGEAVLSHKYEKWVEGEQTEEAYQENIKKWISYCELFTRCWRPEKEIKDISRLYVYCLKRLEQEKSTWEQELRYTLKAIQIERGDLQKEYTDSVPSYGAERQFYIQTHFERWCRLPEQHSRRMLYFGICMRNYHCVEEALRRRFRHVLEKPCFELYAFHLVYLGNLSCTIDCVQEPELFLPALCRIFHYIEELREKQEQKNFRVRALVKPVWDICFNGICLENNPLWIRNLAELFIYLYDKGNCYRDDTYHPTSANHYTDFLTELMSLFVEETAGCSRNHKEIIEYLLRRMEEQRDFHLKRPYGVLLLLAVKTGTGLYLDGLYKGFAIWMEKACTVDLLLSTDSWQFYQEPVWGEMLFRHREDWEKFFEYFTVERLENTALASQKSTMLGIARVALIGLYFLTECIVKVQERISEEQKKLLESVFLKIFLKAQKKWCLFSGENIRLARSEVVIARCMESLSFLSEEGKAQFLQGIGTRDMKELVFWLEYVKDKALRDRFLDFFSRVEKEELLKGIYTIPTMEKLLGKLLDLCFHLNTELQQRTLLEIAEFIYRDFAQEIENRPKYMQEDYKEWLQGCKYQIMLLQGKEKEVLESQNPFYAGLVWLNSDQLEDIVKAKELYGGENQKNSWEWRTNYLIACVLEIVKLKEEGKAYQRQLQQYQKEVKKAERDLEKRDDRHSFAVYVYELFLYLGLEDVNAFWMVYGRMPEELRGERTIREYVIEVHIAMESFEAAQEKLDEMVQLYGEDARIKVLQSRLNQQQENGIEAETRNYQRPEETVGEKQAEVDLVQIRHAIYSLHNISEQSLAEIFVERCDFQQLPEAEQKRMSDYRELYRMKLIFQAMKKLQDYHGNLLHNGKPAKENTYNRTLGLFFNIKEEELLGYHMDDQTQGGLTGHVDWKGEHGPGSRDLLMKRNNNAVALLEGIRLCRVERGKILEHLGRMQKYNAEQVTLFVFPIYCHAKNLSGFWKRYVSYLEELQKESKAGIYRVEEPKYLDQTGFSSGLHYIARTYHDDKMQGIQVVTYHVMIYVGE